MKRTYGKTNFGGNKDVPQQKQAPRNPSVNYRPTRTNFHALAEIPSSLSSSEASENESRTIWSKYKISTAEKLLKNETDSYKLTLPFHRERRIIEKENTPRARVDQIKYSTEGYPSTIRSSNNKFPKPAPRNKIISKNVDVIDKMESTKRTLDESITSFRKPSVASIYAPKSTKQEPGDKQRKKKPPFSRHPNLSGHIKKLLDKEPEVKPRVSFSGIANLNDRIERLESLLNRQDSEISDDFIDLNKWKNEIVSNGNTHRMEALHHSIRDPVAFTQRVHRLQINTEIVQYYVLYGIITILGLILIVMTVIWLHEYNGDLSDMINLHIILSMVGFLVMSTQGILMFRTIRYFTKDKSLEVYWTGNMTHTCVHLVSVVISCTAIVMAFMSRNAAIPPTNNMYTLHAWIGIVTFAFYCLLWFCSLLFFLPQLRPSIFRICLPTHVAFGMTSFFLIVSSCLSGFMEEIMRNLGDAYSELPPSGVLVNCIGVLIIVYCGFVIYIIQTVKDV